MKKKLYKEDLDILPCNNPECDHTSHDQTMFFHSVCHPDDPLWVSYEDGCLDITCSVCGKRIALVAVAAAIFQAHIGVAN